MTIQSKTMTLLLAATLMGAVACKKDPEEPESHRTSGDEIEDEAEETMEDAEESVDEATEDLDDDQ